MKPLKRVKNFIFRLFIRLLSVVTSIVFFSTHINGWVSKNQELIEVKRKQSNARTYEEWYAASLRLDELEGKEEWKRIKNDDSFDSNLIECRTKLLQGLASIQDYPGIVMALREGLLRKIGNIGDPSLYTKTHVGTKYLIEEYLNEVVKQIEFVSESQSRNIFDGDVLGHIASRASFEQQKFDFFFEISQAFGRTALLLSGGASLGCYHFGVVKALHEQNLLPRIISGSSVGALVSSLIATLKDEDLPKIFESGYLNYDVFTKRGEKGAWKRKLIRFITKGVLMDINMLKEVIRNTIGDITFREAYYKTGRILNITIASTSKFELPRLLNYLTAPNVVIWSAACASCALWGLYEPVELIAKDQHGNLRDYHPSPMKWSDGSVENDLPMTRLSELFNVNFFIVSQVNPHVVPFLSRETSSKFGLFSSLIFLAKSELKHRIFQIAELGLLPSFCAKLQPLITQKYEGDITIIPKVTLKAYANIVSNPTEEFRQMCIRGGEKSTWPKISIIKNLLVIERALEKALRRQRLEVSKLHPSQGDADDSKRPMLALPDRLKSTEILNRIDAELNLRASGSP